MEKIVIKRPLASEGIPPLIADREESLAVFAELLARGATFYPGNEDEASEGYPRVFRIVPLAES